MARASGSRFTVGTLAEVAGFFGVALDTVKSWRAMGMPGKPGAFDLSAIARWDRARGDARRGDTNLDQTIKQARALREAARAQREQIGLERDRGNLIERAVHERELVQRSSWLSQVLDRLPGLAPRLANKKRVQVRKILREVQRELRGLAFGAQEATQRRGDGTT